MNIIKIGIVLFLTTLLSGCRLNLSSDELTKPPKLDEQKEIINEMIQHNLSEDQRLINVNSKEGMSSIKMEDIDGDKKKEILTFSATIDNKISYITIFNKKGKAYEKTIVHELEEVTIDKLILEDITNSGKKDIIVETTNNSSKNTKLNMFSNKEKEKIWEREYTNYFIEDMNSKGEKNILIANTHEGNVTIDYYKYNDKGESIEFIDEIVLKKERNPKDFKLVKMKNGKKGIEVEKAKNKSTIVYIDNSEKLKIN